jgi:hypothetical protein
VYRLGQEHLLAEVVLLRGRDRFVVLALAAPACDTVKKPIRGFDEPPPGSIVLDDEDGGMVTVWPLFDLPQTEQVFHPRLDGREVVHRISDQAFYYSPDWVLQGWTGGWNGWIEGIEPGTHVVGLVDGAGQSWGQSAPLAVPAGGKLGSASGQYPAVIFAHFDGTVSAWNVDPATQDGDMATDEITVTNLVDADVVVERCLISSGHSSSCTSVGTVAAGAELLTVEKMADVSSKDDDYQALVVHLASDAGQSYQRDLIRGGGHFNFGSTCQVERIVFHGTRQGGGPYGPTSGALVAMSSCYGYGSGPM